MKIILTFFSLFLLFSFSSQAAIKIIDLPSLYQSFVEYATPQTVDENLKREIEIMRKLKHRNIIQLLDVYWPDNGTGVYICMELVDGPSLLKCVPPGGMAEDLAKNYFYQIAMAVSYCHANNVRTS